MKSDGSSILKKPLGLVPELYDRYGSGSSDSVNQKSRSGFGSYHPELAHMLKFVDTKKTDINGLCYEIFPYFSCFLCLRNENRSGDTVSCHYRGRKL